MAKLRGREEYPIYYGAKPEILRVAGELRKNMTSAENVLWNKLRNRKILGFRFRRQHPLNEFVVDFFCYEARLVIELDGEVHDSVSQKERDYERTQILRNFGLKELRFRNEEVMNKPDSVLAKIEDELKKV